MIKKIIIATVIMINGSIGLSIALPNTALANCPDGKILTLKPWYDGLMNTKNPNDPNYCSIDMPQGSAKSMAGFIWKIVLNIVDDLFQIVAYITTGFIMYGGFLMLTASGSPDRTSKAIKTIINAMIGLVIALASIAIVNLVSSRIGI